MRWGPEGTGPGGNLLLTLLSLWSVGRGSPWAASGLGPGCYGDPGPWAGGPRLTGDLEPWCCLWVSLGGSLGVTRLDRVRCPSLEGYRSLLARSLGLRWRSGERLAGDLDRLLGSPKGPLEDLLVYGSPRSAQGDGYGL